MGFGQAAGFEGQEVALDGLLGLGELRIDCGDLALLAFAVDLLPSGGVPGDAVEQVVRRVGLHQRVEDGVIEFLGGEPFGVAALGAVAVAGEAGVVAVPPAATSSSFSSM
ncbi:MAG: hypothetical protein M3454_05175 [Actinomycetota bacterium]|nr:hypothetical protein [Actinomycetota bacterium]